MDSNEDSEIISSNDECRIDEETWAEKLLNIFYPIPDQTREQIEIAYPQKPNRYNAWGWNRNYQECYSEEDSNLLENIQSAYQGLSDKDQDNFFGIKEEKHWYEFWKCIRPVHDKMLPKMAKDSFTLPNRDAKDPITYPLWSLADNMARRIANWQGERIKDQDIHLMNDPVMLTLDELKHWFFNILSNKECKKEDINDIRKRQSYIVDLLHLIPNFGPDRLYLLEIRDNLDEALNIVLKSIANKQLPERLTDIITSGKSLENSIGTYLHFLLVDEPVADNFLTDYLDKEPSNCRRLSPVCKIFDNASRVYDRHSNAALTPYQQLSKFFTLDANTDKDGIEKIQMNLKQNCLKDVRFANFVRVQDKKNYLDAIVTLEALINVRKTLEKFRDIQTSLGSYIFAFHYVKIANVLAKNYINLVDKAQSLIQNLHQSARDGLKRIISYPQQNQNQYFEKNLRALETKITEGTSVSAQLNSNCEDAKKNMMDYQDAMKKLFDNLKSGKANEEVSEAMHALFVQINQMNSFLPALLGKTNFIIHPEETSLISTGTQSENNIDVTKTKEDVDVPSLFDFGTWDKNIKKDPITKKPIFTYRVYKNEMEMGSIEFYGKPLLCFSPDLKRHNIVNRTGIFNSMSISPRMSIHEVCEALPPTLFDKVIYSSMQGALHGFIRGASNVLAITLQSRGTSVQIAKAISQFTYYGSLFAIKFANYLQDMQEANSENCINALCLAAFEMSKVIVTNLSLNTLIYLLGKASDFLKQNNWPSLSKSIEKCSSLIRYGIFSYNAVENGLAVTAGTVLSGAASEAATEKIGHCLLASR